MKKLLSLALAVMMLLACVPVLAESTEYAYTEENIIIGALDKRVAPAVAAAVVEAAKKTGVARI